MNSQNKPAVPAHAIKAPVVYSRVLSEIGRQRALGENCEAYNACVRFAFATQRHIEANGKLRQQYNSGVLPKSH